jgi:hypothetical protein
MGMPFSKRNGIPSDAGRGRIKQSFSFLLSFLLILLRMGGYLYA